MLIAYNMRTNVERLPPRTVRLSDAVWRSIEREARREQRTVSDFLRIKIEGMVAPLRRKGADERQAPAA